MKNFEQVCRLVRQGLDDGAYPSACLSVGIRGSVCVRQTFGPARETTLYDIASLSKIVGTTMIAFRFLEEGQLRLYDTVEQFFPAPEDKKGITVLQLMTHTSGLPAHFYLSEKRTAPETPSGRSLPTRWSMRQALCRLQLHGIHPSGAYFGTNRRPVHRPAVHRSMYSSLWA
jgi:CubicO group peptidase (beta-lactamase class C family)